MHLYLPQSPPTRMVALRVTRQGRPPQYAIVPNAAVFTFVGTIAAQAAALGAGVEVRDVGESGGMQERQGLLDVGGDDWP